MRKGKGIYKLRNWSEYNRGLVQRGNIFFWFSHEAVEKWHFSGPYRQGSPRIYSDLAIQISVTLRSLLSLPLRNLQGFIQALKMYMKIDISVPNYTTICRRQKKLKIFITKTQFKNEPIHIVVDSTGLKVFGEGEWKVRSHGYTKHRMWRKLHLAINPKTGNIIAQSVTTNSVTDSDAGVDLLRNINQPIDTLFGDAGYDRFKIYNACKELDIFSVIRPQKRARIRLPDIVDSPWNIRNEHIIHIRNQGLTQWKKQSGYTKRSLVETAIFRYKTTFSDKPLAHSLENQRVEVALNCNILNTFLTFGKPDSYAVTV